jgi:hypothetical protein
MTRMQKALAATALVLCFAMPAAAGPFEDGFNVNDQRRVPGTRAA